MKRISENIGYTIFRMFLLILLYLILTIVVILAIPYAILRGACNIEYYEDWVDFVFKYLNPPNKK